MKLISRTWTALSWIAGVYAIANQLKTLNQAKNELYNELPAAQQEQWNNIFGNPGPIVIQDPIANGSRVTQIESIKAGV